ncbi:hypothetical protein PFISCL1PPCAC_13628 [Pristionchus fissidentatus]|uniref:Serpin domain-containing protein n=1 Tax=Pristionchus fissidentatus TaxID=1538716 RepID=A0AAV5VSB3_9BILA|nr:hypothetical protein PFISCL1PPCAC_13628 [Pristionchus fissidentatus]
MVCSTEVLSSSLALSLLRHSPSPSESFVLSPFSLNSAFSIIHDGSKGTTEKELTNLLLKGCTPADVTSYYSSLTLSLSRNNNTGVSFTSANRFYVDSSISLKKDYQKHVEDKYKMKVAGIKLRVKNEAAKEMNTFVEEATNGKIRDIIKADQISDDAMAILINAIHFLGNWKFPFNPISTNAYMKFKGLKGEREMDFMNHYAKNFPVNKQNQFGTALILPYKDENYRFFFLMPEETSNIEKMRNDLTGDKLITILKDAQSVYGDFTVPKFTIEPQLDGVSVLKKLGVSNLFADNADLSKISGTPLKVSKIQQKAVIEVNEEGSEAAAATMVEAVTESMRPHYVIDRPFLYGILRNEDLLFIGQFV